MPKIKKASFIAQNMQMTILSQKKIDTKVESHESMLNQIHTFLDIKNEPVAPGKDIEFHKQLLDFYKQLSKQQNIPELERFNFLNMLLKSALKNGDFLTLSSLIYKTSREIPNLSIETQKAVLPDYYETTSLYHFYEKEIKNALTEMEYVLDNEEENEYIMNRRRLYYISMLIAAPLPLQARAFLDKIKTTTDFYLLKLLEVIIDFETHLAYEDMLIKIKNAKNAIANDKEKKNIFVALGQIELLLEKKQKSGRPTATALFADDWENVLRVDIWLQAKMENKFYYNLLTEEWQQRKKVFN